MSSRVSPARTSPLFWCSVPLAAAVTWGVHEFGHYAAGRALGYDMWMSLNQAGPNGEGYTSSTHGILVAMAGPAVTYAQALLALYWIRRRESLAAYAYLFLAFFMRLTAFAVSFAHPNDEAGTSLDLGWPMWVLPSVVVTLLLFCTVSGSRRLRVGWRTNAGLYVLASLLAAAIVFGDPYLGRLIG